MEYYPPVLYDLGGLPGLYTFGNCTRVLRPIKQAKTCASNPNIDIADNLLDLTNSKGSGVACFIW